MSQTESFSSFNWDIVPASIPALPTMLQTIAQFTERLFPGPVTFAQEADPAEPATSYIVFTATAQGTWPEVRERVAQWHREVDSLCPEPVNFFRLDVHPQ